LSILPHEGLVAQERDAALERLSERAIVAWVAVQDLDGGEEWGVLGGHGGWVEGLADGGAVADLGRERVAGQKPARASPPLTTPPKPCAGTRCEASQLSGQTSQNLWLMLEPVRSSGLVCRWAAGGLGDAPAWRTELILVVYRFLPRRAPFLPSQPVSPSPNRSR